MLWLILALIGALATSLTTIFAKIGIKNVNSDFATFFRTGIVIVCALILCFITGSIYQIGTLTTSSLLFLLLSGFCTGCSWLCYYKALKLGNINKVAPIDKSSFVLTSILFVIFFFNDSTNNGDALTICMLALSVVLMLSGTIMTIDKKNDTDEKSSEWLIYAILSAVFASLVSFLCKIGLSGISSDLGTLIRTVIVFVFAGAIVLARKKYKDIKSTSWKDWFFLTLSGAATGVAWLSEYYALNMNGVNPVAVSSAGKLSIVFTMAFSFLVLKEKFSKKSLCGLALLIAGTVVIIVFSL